MEKEEWEIRVTDEFLGWFRTMELRPGSTGGDKSGNWSRWYVEAVAEAERLYAMYLSERSAVEDAPTQGGRS